MRRKLLTFELLLAVEIIARAILPSILTWKVSALFNGVLLILKFLLEGYRLNWILFIISGLLSALPWAIFRYLAILVVLFPIIHFPLYHHLKPKGPYRVGYRVIQINKTLQASVYYPTDHRGPDSPQFASQIKPWQNFYDSVRMVGSKMPLWYIKIALTYLDHLKLGVNTNVPIIPEFSQSRRAFPVIIFSHGLATCRNDYSFYLKELASRGYIVVSADHSDIVYPPSGRLDDIAHRNIDLKKRLVELQSVLTFVVDPNGLKSLFDENIEIDTTRVSAIGHSFGGGSAAYLTLMDSRITGACLCLDPYYMALEEEAYKEINRPLLIITTKRFEEVMPDNRVRAEKFANLNQNFIKQTMLGFLEHACHNNLADNGLFMAREVEQSQALGPVRLIKKHFRNHAALIEAFLEVMVLEREKGVVKDRTDVIRRMKEKVYFPDIQFLETNLKGK